MTVNRGGVLSKEYFHSYLRLIMKSRECTVDLAKELTFDLFFKNDKDRFGKYTYIQFLAAYKDLK